MGKILKIFIFYVFIANIIITSSNINIEQDLLINKENQNSNNQIKESIN